MWRRLLERFVPSMEEGPSTLDRLDGVGWSAHVTPVDGHPWGAGAIPRPRHHQGHAFPEG